MGSKLIQTNFRDLKLQFKRDTHLDADDNLELYIAYFHATMADFSAQRMSDILNELEIIKNAIKSFPKS